MGLLTFPLGVLLPVALYAAFGTFWLGQYEHAWGAWGTLQITLWVGIIAGLFAAIPFGVAASVLGRYPSAWLSFVLGATVSVISLATIWLVSPTGAPLFVLGIVYFGLSAAAPLMCRRKRAAHQLPSQLTG